MRQLRASRKNSATLSSRDDDEATSQHQLPDTSEDEEASQLSKASTGKLRRPSKPGHTQKPTPKSTAHQGPSITSPVKTKATKAKAKAIPQDSKPSVRPIYSFFNAATQRQRTPQPSASPQKSIASEGPSETIQDDSEDETDTGLKISNGSSIALAMRKRKLHNDNFGNDLGLPSSASQKFRKASGGERIPSFSVTKEDARPWTDQFAPKDLSELAVHKRKVADIRQWLEITLNGRRQKILVLKGAAGVGKTTTLRLLAKDLGAEIVEWKNPDGPVVEGSATAAVQFDEFMARAGRSGGLQLSSSHDSELNTSQRSQALTDTSTVTPTLLLIEEFPSTFSRSSVMLTSFRSSLLQYLSSLPPSQASPTPAILIVSETLLSSNTALADSFTAHRLLGPELINHPYLDMIEFNAVAPTILTKALELVAVKEARKSGRRKTPGPQVLKRLADSGDVRSAVSSLEFLCLRGDDGDTWSSRINFTKPKKARTEPSMTKSEEEALKLITNRESTLDIFHAVGKVVYNKRQDPSDASAVAQPPSWLPQHRRTKVPDSNVDELLYEVGTDTSTFVAALHENYALSCWGSTADSTLDSLSACINSISEADLLSVDRFSFGTRAFAGSATDSLRQDELAFHVAVRGMLFDLPCPVQRREVPGGKKADAFRMFYPSSLKLWKKREEIEDTINLLIGKLRAGGLDDPSFRPKAHSSRGGVEGWNRIRSVNNSSTLEGAEQTGIVNFARGAKVEMLLERLPYMTQIVSSRVPSSGALDHLNRVTRVHGLGLTQSDDENVEEEDGLENIAPEQWTTDAPEGEGIAKKRSSAGVKPKGPHHGNGSALAASFDNIVEKLVLEDDDIVDD